MKRILLALCLLTACREEAAIPQPVALNAEAVGYFCQMNILDHGGPKAQLHLDSHPGNPLFFSQVRDVVSYLRMPEKDGQVLATYVTDMSAGNWAAPATLPWIAADSAIYVVGSTRRGGMDQPEFVPFGSAGAAKAFIAQFGGQAMTLAEIPQGALATEAQAPDTEASSAAEARDYNARLHSHAQGHGTMGDM
ncbi:nitrous oxide reductase accessory protein NosL [Rhodobacter capsulatus]|uniref:nitrous oxide reductase accessory protein NosL n=1 Tax=Rhodobacter capsulatus TaxID=1061 RepID=UPI00402A3434